MANPISDFFGSILKPKDTKVLGIDIGSSSVKVVQLKKQGGKAVLETYGEIAIGPYCGTDIGRSAVLSADKLSEVVKDLLKESNTTTLNSGLSISIGSSFIVFIKMLTSEQKNYPEMVPIEARKYIPVPISEVTLDWWAIPKDEKTVSEFQNGQKVEDDKMTEILLVVINNEALNKNRDIQKLAGLQTTFSEVEIFSCMRAALDPGIAPQMIMDFGAGSTKIFVVLSVPVRGDGTIDADEIAFLEGMAKWMEVNSEGIYGTRPWKIYGEGPSTVEAPETGHFGGAKDVRSKPYTAEDIRFTTKGGVLYAYLMEWPANHTAVVKALATNSRLLAGHRVITVSLLGYSGPLVWAQSEAGLTVQLPATAPSENVIALKITGIE